MSSPPTEYEATHGHVSCLKKTDLVEFEFYPEASCLFARDAAVDRQVRPKARVDAESLPDNSSPVRLTLLRLICTVKQYGEPKSSAGVTVWQMVVMDGSNAIFKLVVNSRESQDIPHEDLIPGCTIIVQPGDYRFIYMQQDEGIMRAVFFVDTFDFAPGPTADPDNDATSTVTPEFSTIWLDKSAINNVEHNSVMLFLKSFKHEDGFHYWVPLSAEQHQQGEFISSEDGLRLWLSRKRKSSPCENCGCVRLPYHFSSCMVESIPLSQVNINEVFHSEVKKRLKGRVHATSFDGLSSSHKRWCYYWYYAVNFFHLGGQDANELPECFVSAVRKAYPDAAGHYKGFMSRDQRQEKSLEEM
jgi:hypothetical protein